MAKDLNVLWMYPSILNLHGDRGNIMALKRWAHAADIPIHVKRIETYQDDIDWDAANFILFSPGQLKDMPRIIKRLKKDKREIENFIELGKVFLVIGTTGCVFARRTVRRNGKKFRGLDIFPISCQERQNVYGNDLIFKTKDNDDLTIVGSQIQVVDTEVRKENGKVFGKLQYGYGNNGGIYEGIRVKNAIWTNTLGPLLVKNPELTIALMEEATHQTLLTPSLSKKMTIEKQSAKAIQAFHNH